MDLDFASYLDPWSYLPVGLLGWVMQILPAASGIWIERTGLRLARSAYLGALAWRIIGVILLTLVSYMAVLNLIFTHDPASDYAPPDVAWLFVIKAFTGMLLSFILVRPLVRRLNDAGIDKKWAYLAVLPYLDLLIFIGLIFYPPSKAPADQDMAPAPAQP